MKENIPLDILFLTIDFSGLLWIRIDKKSNKKAQKHFSLRLFGNSMNVYVGISAEVGIELEY